MFHTQAYTGTKEENYALVIEQLQALISDEKNVIANLANAAALLNYFLHDINWVGFYIAEGNELVLGPFQGLPACVRIPFGKGVCGTAAIEKRTVRVADVHTFPGHIACDAASQSEIVVPMMKNGVVIGVLDIDSPIKNRFDEIDEQYLQRFVETLVQHLNI
ncbi:GAF domain-containing protein [Anoxybacillus sp. CHMUD]|uniref:GAF domain-containing protein n=1 Tax=Anoxybacillus sp. CHMUD TaxID=2508870 RepID=UPI0010094507|nr:GAF domain-containing protein [Anoxybacillus sp. CHMUD]NNU90513.1 GAF domain-containing protein [Anoxybacillus sp. CHMUD]QAV27537.1 histidine kinase [Neobacillus thermocopriae]